MTAWLARFNGHARDCLAHIAWGAFAGIAGGIDGLALFIGGLAYQFGSGWRKAETEGAPDTVGLDAFDYAIGYAIGYALRFPLAYWILLPLGVQ